MSWGGGIGLPREASLRPLQLSAPRLLLASFAGMIAFGTAGLTLLPGVYIGAPLGLVDALFTITSAVCVTGLSVVDVGTTLAPFGQVWLLLMIQAGGLGFVVIQDLRLRLRGRKRRLSTHSRLTLLVSAWLLVGATALFSIFEAGETLAGLDIGDRLANAAFMAATPRTAGFNAVDYDEIADPSLFLTLGLMWIGGSPGSTAGGVKTTTVALLALLLFARLRGDRAVSTGGRTVPEETLQRAVGLAVGSVILLALFVFALLVTELPASAEGDRVRFVRLVFEAQSALGTVGLSMGATAELTPAGRLLVVALMFLGRVGPLAVLGAMAIRGQRRVAMRYAHEDVLVG